MPPVDVRNDGDRITPFTSKMMTTELMPTSSQMTPTLLARADTFTPTTFRIVTNPISPTENSSIWPLPILLMPIADAK